MANFRSGSYQDGSSGASTAAPDFPHALDLDSETNTFGVSLTIRPPWQVANVDYGVGPNTGTTFKIPGVDTLPTGATLTSGFIRIDGASDVVFDGWSFQPETGAASGWAPYVNDTFTGNLTFTNCKWKLLDNGKAVLRISATANNPGRLTVRHCEVDGNFLTGGNADYNMMVPAGGALIEYNRFINAGSDVLNCFPAAGTTSVICRYNSGYNFGWAQTVHSDFFQFWIDPGGAGGTAVADMRGVQVYGNFWAQPAANGSGFPAASNALVRIGDLGTRNCFSPEVHHNTAMGIGNTGHIIENGTKLSPALLQLIQFATVNSPYGWIFGAGVTDNYVYTTGGGSYNTGTLAGFQNGPFYPTTGSNQNTMNNTYARNINMRDGSSLLTNP